MLLVRLDILAALPAKLVTSVRIIALLFTCELLAAQFGAKLFTGSLHALVCLHLIRS